MTPFRKTRDALLLSHDQPVFRERTLSEVEYSAQKILNIFKINKICITNQ